MLEFIKLHKKTCFAAFGVLFFFFSVLTVFGNQGLLKLKSLYDFRQKIREENQELMVSNQKLHRELELFKNPLYLQQIIREKLGYVKKNELVLLLNEKTEETAPILNLPAEFKKNPSLQKEKAAQKPIKKQKSH